MARAADLGQAVKAIPSITDLISIVDADPEPAKSRADPACLVPMPNPGRVLSDDLRHGLELLRALGIAPQASTRQRATIRLVARHSGSSVLRVY